MSVLPSNPAQSPRRDKPADPHGSQSQCWRTEASSSKLQNHLHQDLCRPVLMYEALLQQIPAEKIIDKPNTYCSCIVQQNKGSGRVVEVL